MPAAERCRLFFALVPGAAVRGRLAAVAERAVPPGARLVPPRSLHLTLVFLGSLTASLRPAIENAAAALALPRFELTLDSLGGWSRPGILWCGVSRPPAGLTALQAALARAMGGLLASDGHRAEHRLFHAHVTLARGAGASPRRTLPPIRWSARRFHLLESRLHGDGARYQVLGSWTLEQGARDLGAAECRPADGQRPNHS